MALKFLKNHFLRFITIGCVSAMFLVLSAPAAKAAPTATCPLAPSVDVTESAAALARRIPHQLQKLGLHRIGNFDIDEFNRKISSVRYCLLGGGYLSGSAGDRLSSIYLVKLRTVSLNQLSWQWVDGEARAALVMHESLGALGYDDESYQLTLALWFLTQIPRDEINDFLSSRLSEPLRLARATNDEHVYVMAGGVTGIGGGGDNVGLEAKMILWKTFYARKKGTLEPGAENVMQIVQLAGFESNWDPSYQTTKVRFGPRSRLKVKFSAVMWNVMGRVDLQIRLKALQPVIALLRKRLKQG